MRPEEDKEVQKKRATNAFFRLEKIVEDEKNLLESVPYLEKLFNAQESRWKNDYLSSQLARGKFRVEKKDAEFQRKLENDMLKKRSISGLELLPEKTEDIEMAKNTKFTKLSSNCNLATLVSRFKGNKKK